MQFCQISAITFLSVDYYTFYILFLPPTFLSRLSTYLHQIWHERIFLRSIHTENNDSWKAQKAGHCRKNKSRKKNYARPAPSRFFVMKRLILFCDDI